MQPLGHAGLTLATSVGALFNALALLVLLRRKRRFYAPLRGWGMFIAKVVVGDRRARRRARGDRAGPASTWLAAGLVERGRAARARSSRRAASRTSARCGCSGSGSRTSRAANGAPEVAPVPAEE